MVKICELLKYQGLITVVSSVPNILSGMSTGGFLVIDPFA
jgi:hypothetical protein